MRFKVALRMKSWVPAILISRLAQLSVGAAGTPELRAFASDDGEEAIARFSRVLCLKKFN